MKCNICELEFKSRAGIKKHLIKKHNYNKKEVAAYFLNILKIRGIGRPAGFKHTEEEKERHRQWMLKNNPFKGKKHTQKTKIKMSVNHADFTGENNPFTNKYKKDLNFQKQFKAKHKALWKERQKDSLFMEAFKTHLSKAMSASVKLKGEYLHKFHKAQFLKTEKAGQIFCRSSWEVHVANFLDKNIYVKDFSLENFCVEYLDEKQNKRYTRIDFIINFKNENKLMLEVKPLPLQQLQVFKIKGYKEYCKKSNIQFCLYDYSRDNLETILLGAKDGKFFVND
jgi:hypothetical protein